MPLEAGKAGRTRRPSAAGGAAAMPSSQDRKAEQTARVIGESHHSQRRHDGQRPFLLRASGSFTSMPPPMEPRLKATRKAEMRNAQTMIESQTGDSASVVQQLKPHAEDPEEKREKERHSFRDVLP